MTGEELRSLRKRLRLTQWQLAAALGVSLGQLGNWERGRQRQSGRPAPIPRVVELAIQHLISQSQQSQGRTE
jgi:DNA-binding transcriptional regulator YiaG